MKVGIVIPAYNEGRHVRNVLLKIVHHFPDCRVYVVDDGSSDDTAGQCAMLDVRVLRFTENRGKGEALKTGLAAAAADGHDYCLTMDADGQHEPESIADFIAAAESGNADLILGRRRFRRGVMPPDRILSNRISSLLVSALVKRRIPDSQCGFRMIKAGLMPWAELKTSHFELETELLVKALRSGASLDFVTVPVVYNTIGGSSIRRFKDTVRFCRLYMRLIFTR
ncbi:glycosyltransferase family 2 protein [bacterium]|nr:glycosyltransferase family 2 protein [bacterium]